MPAQPPRLASSPTRQQQKFRQRDCRRPDAFLFPAPDSFAKIRIFTIAQAPLTLLVRIPNNPAYRIVGAHPPFRGVSENCSKQTHRAARGAPTSAHRPTSFFTPAHGGLPDRDIMLEGFDVRAGDRPYLETPKQWNDVVRDAAFISNKRGSLF
jgi:hypothetical protein